MLMMLVIYKALTLELFKLIFTMDNLILCCIFKICLLVFHVTPFVMWFSYKNFFPEKYTLAGNNHMIIHWYVIVGISLSVISPVSSCCLWKPPVEDANKNDYRCSNILSVSPVLIGMCYIILSLYSYLKLALGKLGMSIFQLTDTRKK